MSARPDNRPRWADWLLALVAVVVLAVCLSYTFAYVFLVPYPGMTFAYGQWQVTSIDPCDAHPGWCQANPAGLQVGDQLITIGDLTYERYFSDRRHVPFDGYRPGESAPITFIHDGRQQTIQWQMPVITNADRVKRLNGLLYYLPFWLVGTAILLFMRPRDRRWQLLVASNYMMAAWLAMGDVSVSCVAASSLLTHAAAWLLAPIYLHMHLLVPTPLFKQRSRRLVPLLYAIALVLALLELFQLLPGSAYWLGLLLIVAGSLGLLVWRLFDKTSLPGRLATRLMLAGLSLAYGPSLVLWLIPQLLGYSTGAITTCIVALAIPLWPLFYLYAIYKRRLGLLEFRVNRLLSLYSFVVLYLTAFTVILLAGWRWMPASEGSLVFILIVSTVFVVAAPALRAPFQQLVDRLAYGIEYNPDEVLRAFANRIPTILDRKALAPLLTDEIVPSLLIRQSALYLLDGGEADLVYARGVSLEETPETPQQVYPLLAEAGQYRLPPAETVEAWNELPAGPGFDWVRLAVPLKMRDKTTGVWLFGRRDPDDYYPQHDIALLTTLASQVAVAVENARLHEAVQQELCERKQAEAALRESEERYHVVSELASDFAGAFHIGMDGTIMREWLTGAYSRITGFDVGEVDTHGFWVTLVHPDDMPVAARHLRTLFSGQPDVCELRIVTSSGQVRWLSNSGRPVWDAAQGRVIRIYSASQDITERKRAEQALLESEAKLRTLFEILPVGVSILDAERKVSYVNSALGGILDISMEGLFRGDYNGRTILRPDGTLMPAEEYASVRAFKEQRAVHNVETGVVTEAGKVIWVSVNAVPVAFPAWKVVVVTADITERKRAEEEIASLAKFPAENPDPVLRLSRDGIVIYANAASDALLGMWDCAVGSYAPQSWRDLIAQALASGQNKSIDVECAEKVYSFFVTPVAEAGYVNLYGRDITERKQAEERLRRETARAEALACIAARLNAQLDLDAVLNAVCQETAHALNVPVASVALYQPESQAFVPAAVFGLPPQALQDIAPLSRALYQTLFGPMEPSVVVLDLQAVPDLTNTEFYARHDLRSTAAVGLVREDDLVGVLSIHTVGQPRAFDADELGLLKAIADQVAQAINNARLLQETRQHAARLTLLNRIARTFTATLNLDELMEIIHREITITMEADAFFIALYDRAAGELDFRIRVDKGVRELPERRPLTTGLTSSIIASKQPVLIRDFEQEKEHLPLVQVWGTIAMPSSWLAMPILLGEDVIGIISVQAYRPNAYGEAELELLDTIADTVAVAIENARLYEAVHTGQQQLRNLAEYLQTAREEERTLIAREIHDEFGQALTALKMDVTWLARQLPRGKPRLIDKTRTMLDLLDSTIQTVRRVAADLRPGLLDDLGLAAAMEWQAQEFAERMGIECALHLGEEQAAFDRDLSTAIFRIFQETLTNIARHAQATRVQVEVKHSQDVWTLTVQDNGKGIAGSQIADPHSLGLMGIRERARAWGGEVTFEGVPGQGTTVAVRIPRAPVKEKIP